MSMGHTLIVTQGDRNASKAQAYTMQILGPFGTLTQENRGEQEVAYRRPGRDRGASLILQGVLPTA